MVLWKALNGPWERFKGAAQQEKNTTPSQQIQWAGAAVAAVTVDPYSEGLWVLSRSAVNPKEDESLSDHQGCQGTRPLDNGIAATVVAGCSNSQHST
jgi:hypothetical protein